MKHTIFIVFYLFLLVIGTGPLAHAVGFVHTDDPMSTSAAMGDDYVAPLSAGERAVAYCCTGSGAHCSSATLRQDIAIHEIHYSVVTQDRPLDDMAKSKPAPGIDPPPPRV